MQTMGVGIHCPCVWPVFDVALGCGPFVHEYQTVFDYTDHLSNGRGRAYTKQNRNRQQNHTILVPVPAHSRYLPSLSIPSRLAAESANVNQDKIDLYETCFDPVWVLLP